MSQELRRSLCLAAASGVLAAFAGCGEAPKAQEAAATVPANVQESNKNMQDFMKNQGAAAKK